MWTVPILHPAFTFRQPNKLGPLAAHVHGFVGRLVKGFPPDPDLRLDPSPEVFQRFIAQVKKHKVAMGVDVEAMPPRAPAPRAWALLPGAALLRAIGVGAAIGNGIGLSWFYPVQPVIWNMFSEVMNDPSIPKVFMNGFGYDIPLLERYGLQFAGRIHDISDGRRALVSTSPTGLAFQAAIYLRCAAWKAEAREDENDEKGFVDATKIKRHKLLKYNAEDCVRTAQIRAHHIKDFNEDPTDKQRRLILYQQGLRLSRVAAQMSLDGIKVNQDQRRKLSKDLFNLSLERAKSLAKALEPYCKVKICFTKKEADKAKSEYFRITMTGGVNESDLAALIYRESRKPHIKSFELEVPWSKFSRTDSGKPAVNKDALLFLFTLSNIPIELLNIIRLAWKVDAPLKARSTYIESDKVISRIGPDGRVHPSHKSAAAETGRWTCKDPNLYNIPEAQEEDKGSLRGDMPNIRSMYEAEKGYVIVHRDYRAFELEVMADVTNDKLLKHGLESGDVHSARARAFFDLPPDIEVPKPVRKNGKVVGLASQYHAGPETVYMQVLEQIQDADFAEIAAMVAKFPEIHTGIAAHWERSLAFAQQTGYNETRIMHRRRYYPPGVHLKDTETGNYEVQGTAADIANCTMVGALDSDYVKSLDHDLKKFFPKARLILHTYDSFDIEAPEKEAQAVDRLLEEKMAGPWKVGSTARLYASDGKIGKSLGDV